MVFQHISISIYFCQVNIEISFPFLILILDHSHSQHIPILGSKRTIIVHFFNLSLGNRRLNLKFKNLNLDIVKVLAWTHGGTKKAYLVLIFELWTLWFVFLKNLIMFKFCDFIRLCFKLSKTNIWKLCFELCKFVLILTFIKFELCWLSK